MTDIATFYGSFYQQPLLLAVPTLLWLLALLMALRPRDAVWKYCFVFAALSALDAFLTANDVLGTGPWTGVWASVVPITFVVLGDFRVYFWTQPGSFKKKWPLALALSAVVPLASMGLGQLFPADWAANSRVLYLTYELLFLAFFSLVTLKVAGTRGFKDPYRAYALGYYACWAAADVWLLQTNGTADAAWILRIAANLLYYAGWTPWVYFQARRRNGSPVVTS